MKNILITTFAFFAMHGLVGQPFIDVLNAKYQNFAPVKYLNKNETVQVSEVETNVRVPIVFKNKNVLIIGANLDALTFSFSESSTKKYLYSTSVLGIYLHNWKDSKWKSAFVSIAKVNADKILLSHSTYQFGGAQINTCALNEKFAFKLGLYYNREFSGNFWIPLVGFDWRPTKRFWLYGFISTGGITAEYKLSNKFYVGIYNSSSYQTYRITNSNRYVLNGDPFFSNNHIKAFVNFYSTKNLMFYSEFGTSFMKRYVEYYSKKNPTSDPYYSATHDGMLFNIGMAFRVRTDQEPSQK